MPNSDVADRDITGDILRTSGDNPVVHPPIPPSYPTMESYPFASPKPAQPEETTAGGLLVNYMIACEPDGSRCIRYDGPRFLSAAEAHRLAIVLTEAADHVGDTRTKHGYTD